MRKLTSTSTFLFLVFIMVFTTNTVMGKSQTTSANQEQKTDSVQSPPKKMSSRSSWEQIVSFPGTLMNLPFKLFFNGTEGLITVIDKSRIVPEVQDFLISDDGRRGVFPTSAPSTGVGIHFFQKRTSFHRIKAGHYSYCWEKEPAEISVEPSACSDVWRPYSLESTGWSLVPV